MKDGKATSLKMDQVPTISIEPDSTNIVVIGKQGTGKSLLLDKLGKVSLPDYPKGINRTNSSLELKKAKNRIVISELNVPYPLDPICLYNIVKADAFVLVYAVDDAESFEFVEDVKDFIKKHKGEGATTVVVGNKSDVLQRKVLFEIADCTVSIEWELKYLETSAVTGANVAEILTTILKSIKAYSEAIETYEFKGYIFRRNANSMTNIRRSPSKAPFSSRISRSFKDTSSKSNGDQSTGRNWFSFFGYLSRRSSSKIRQSGRSSDSSKLCLLP